MFAKIAPKLRIKGWGSLLPLHNPGKRPIPAGWERYNRAKPTDAQIATWCRTFPGAGIGLAAGPDQVAGFDLDFTDPIKAAEARTITTEVLGETPLARIGLPPKVMLLYRNAGDLGPSRRLGGVEIFTSSGQFVLHSIHPDTNLPYRWPNEGPEAVSPTDLPHITTRMMQDFIIAIAPLCHRPQFARAQASSQSTGSGRAAELLRAFNDNPAGEPTAIAVAALAAAEPGDRHNTMVGAVTALATIGLSDTEIEQVLGDAYSNLFNAHEGDQRMVTFAGAIRWARQRIGEPLDELPPEITAIASARRWP